MGNNYKQFGPFIYGDPRFLAGGTNGRAMSYNDSTLALNDGCVVVPSAEGINSSYHEMVSLGQDIAIGKSGYHGNHNSNAFVGKSDLKFPTVGIEVETVMIHCDADSAKRFTRSIYSNWFHAENDGSLDHAHGGTYGYELVTTVLPARYYRDINVWTGFQNLVSPLLHSYNSIETGLHVHVGMDWFGNTMLPACSQDIAMSIGKLITTKVYYSLLPRSLAQRVFLRNSDLHYCHEAYERISTRPIRQGSGYQVLDDIMEEFLTGSGGCSDVTDWIGAVRVAARSSDNSIRSAPESRNRSISISGLGFGHETEVNAAPHLTLEFRRGKGTTNALSIHRMIELCMLTTMYAGHIIDNPSEEVSQRRYLDYLIENTTSSALRNVIKKECAKLS